MAARAAVARATGATQNRRLAGATVAHGVAGLGAHSVIHAAGLIEECADLPVVIEIVEDLAHVDRLLPILDETIAGGELVTIEFMRVLRYCRGTEAKTGNHDRFGRNRDTHTRSQRTRAAT